MLMSWKRGSGGFTLIEVLIVVVILGVLMAIATPMYQESMRKSRRSEAKRELMELASRQERFYAQYSEYSTDIAGEFGLRLDRTQTENGYYDLDIDPCVDGDGVTIAFDRCYVLLATPVAGTTQASDACGEMSITAWGEREPENTDDLQCW